MHMLKIMNCKDVFLTDSGCPIHYEQVMDKWCFRKSKHEKSWHDALTECQTLKGSLVEVTSIEKQQALEDYLSPERSKTINQFFTMKYSKNQQIGCRYLKP